ncbi:DUF2269 domain-containing protein [Brevundimonas sp. S30B]|uniref:DUF2269 family protein n=1 Tax=unclassified Brevundimonas TaxID=2622653 RepID=UPI001072993F|nr:MULTISPECIES: DUF2269 domain-containing protein [unclassified Brevundimonas]QBX36576.1 DUF2269 domain-containing protein [Brevundimonas sp. MF30-B]TFW00876.1 DUF2269 domain-containing protein [Brevundimonas sp. S30B]
MSLFLLVKLAHIIGATVLFGTGAGIAFFMLMAHRTGSPQLIAHTAGVVVVADTLFSATAVVLQPLTGLWLAQMAGYGLLEPWIVASLALYVVTGVFWLPVVWIQLRLRDLARQSVETGEALPAAYHRLWRIWFACGFPAFAAVLAILWLMVARPTF